MKSFIIICLICASFSTWANPYKCAGASYFGLKSYTVHFSEFKTSGIVNLTILNKKEEIIIDEKVKLKEDYVEQEMINFYGLGDRRAELSGFFDLTNGRGVILAGNKEINLKNCHED